MDRPCVLGPHLAVTFTDWSIGARANARDEGMTCNGLDFSYLGVYGLWQHDLGKIDVNFSLPVTFTNLAASKVEIQKLV